MDNFNQIVNETKRPVLAGIRRYLRAEYLFAIDDVAQEVYLRAYKALKKGSLNDHSKLHSYLYTIAKNESLRMNAKCMREERKAEKYSELCSRQITELEPQIGSFEKEKILSLLPEIPLVYSSVLQLLFDGYKPKEIPGLLGIRPGTVKSRTHRGLIILRGMLDKVGVAT